MSSCWPCGAWCFCWMRSLQYLRLPFSPFPFPLLLYLYVNHRYSHLICSLCYVSFWVCSSFACCPEFFHLQKDWVVISFLFCICSISCMLLLILDLLSRSSSNMSMHHLFANDQRHHIFDLNGIRGQDILEAAKENKVGAIRHFLRSDVNSVQKTDEEGTGLNDVAWVPWSFGGCNVIQWHDAMACNGLEYFRSILLWQCFDLKVEFLWFPWCTKFPFFRRYDDGFQGQFQDEMR